MSDKDTAHSRSIKLKALKPGDYRLWVIQAEATFRIYKFLNIVQGTESKPEVP
jgi:hypothetical protein